MTVMRTLVLLLLCSGFSHFSFASNRLRLFHHPGTIKTWEDSLKECNQTNETFVTLFDEEDANFTVQFVGNRNFWLGLRKSRNITWSNGKPVTFSNSSVTLTDGKQICEAIDDNTTWRGFNCSDMKPFMCYKDNNYTLIKDNKTWCKALQYCRKHYDDLVSINNTEQNDDVIKKGKNTSFWIGLMHDEWEWEDKSCSSFRNWFSAEEHTDGQCTKISQLEPPSMYQSSCTNWYASFCSKGFMRIRVITHINSTWEEAFNYCKAHHTGMLWIEDEEDQKAVKQWLNNTDVGDGPFWIGMRQSRLFGFWIWSDRIVSWANWRNGTQPEPSVFNQCGVINKDDYTWGGEECGSTLPFLCEEEIVFMNK